MESGISMKYTELHPGHWSGPGDTYFSILAPFWNAYGPNPLAFLEYFIISIQLVPYKMTLAPHQALGLLAPNLKILDAAVKIPSPVCPTVLAVCKNLLWCEVQMLMKWLNLGETKVWYSSRAIRLHLHASKQRDVVSLDEVLLLQVYVHVVLTVR